MNATERVLNNRHVRFIYFDSNKRYSLNYIIDNIRTNIYFDYLVVYVKPTNRYNRNEMIIYDNNYQKIDCEKYYKGASSAEIVISYYEKHTDYVHKKKRTKIRKDISL